ncbi:MAG: vitamin B12 dependent methionine synthase [Clostridiales bacterium]|nr:vitamin B12 dependent methionine synthase [Clostridiales bacterium]
MKVSILDDLSFSLDAKALCEKLKLTDDLAEEFFELFDTASAIARPRMAYCRCDIELLDDNRVRVGDMAFKSRILRVNMDDVKQAFPYVATCGRELHDLAESKDDPLEKYWVLTIAETVLYEGLNTALAAIRATEGTGTLYAMNPGSLPDWPLSEQRPLFHLLGDVMGTIGVELTESCLMMPVKSVSGLMFESRIHYTNCALCPRDGCPNRREPYQPEMASDRYDLG